MAKNEQRKASRMRDSDLSYQEILSCLEDAKQGLLSPYWQNYAQRELDTLRDQDGALPPDAKILAEQLQNVLATTPQISDHTFIEQEAALQGNKLIYDCHGASPDAFVILLYTAEEHAYTASVSLPYAAGSARVEAQAIREDLRQWLARQNFKVPPCVLRPAQSGFADSYTSVETAIAAILEALNTAAN
jgi:hypothetical protein